MKQTKITIILDQPLMGDFTADVAKIILSDPQAFGGYQSFSENRVFVEEIDSEADQKTALERAEEKWPCKELSDKLARDEELTPKENSQLFRNMDRQMAYMGAYRESRAAFSVKDAVKVLTDAIKTDEGLRIAYQANIAMAFKTHHKLATLVVNKKLNNQQLHDVANNAANTFLQVFCEANFKRLDNPEREEADDEQN